MPLSNLQARAVETLVHPYTNQATFRDTGPLVLERGKGVYVYDTDGKPYLEGMAGLWCTALGYDNEELVEAAATQMRKLPFAHLFTAKSHDPGIELAVLNQAYSTSCCPLNCALTGDPVRISPGATVVTRIPN